MTAGGASSRPTWYATAGFTLSNIPLSPQLGAAGRLVRTCGFVFPFFFITRAGGQRLDQGGDRQ